LSHHRDVEFALQAEQKGTGHAVMMSEQALADHDGPVLILAGDTPLLRAESLSALLEDQQTQQASCVIGTAVTDANQGLGRIVRDAQGEFVRIVEQKDATPEEAAIREINTGCFVFNARDLFDSLKQIRPNNKQGEYYLTDCPAVLLSQGKRVIAADKLDIEEALGVNTRAQLADAGRAVQQAFLARLMADGVTIVAPELTYIDPRATVGADTIIYPFTSISGPAVIGANCRIGPHAAITGAARIAEGTVVGSFDQVEG
jgi:bifunctional UDP-N-acetylglucosamine pyrophosphorylase / glucosamine-1-phosphate N-acetyltransferase